MYIDPSCFSLDLNFRDPLKVNYLFSYGLKIKDFMSISCEDNIKYILS